MHVGTFGLIAVVPVPDAWHWCTQCIAQAIWQHSFILAIHYSRIVHCSIIFAPYAHSLLLTIVHIFTRLVLYTLTSFLHSQMIALMCVLVSADDVNISNVCCMENAERPFTQWNITTRWETFPSTFHIYIYINTETVSFVALAGHYYCLEIVDVSSSIVVC